MPAVLASSAFWYQLELEVTNVACTSNPPLTSHNRVINVTLELDQYTSTPWHVEMHDNPHDVNDINCPAEMTTASLVEIRLQLDFLDPHNAANGSQDIPFELVISMIDASLRDLICRRLPRLTAGVRRLSEFDCTLQRGLPAIFHPGCAKQIADRVQLIGKIASSIVDCSNRPDLKESLQISGNKLTHDGRERDVCRDAVDPSTLRNSLFTALMYNIGSLKRGKALKPVTSQMVQNPLDQVSNVLPAITNTVSLFDRDHREGEPSSTDLFFQYSDAFNEESVQRSRSANTANLADSLDASNACHRVPLFEDIALEHSPSRSLLEDRDSESGLANQACSVSPSFNATSYSGFEDPVWETPTDVSMIRETKNLAADFFPKESCSYSSGFHMIGEDDKLTQNRTRNSPPEGCAGVGPQERTTVFNAFPFDIAWDDCLSEDLFIRQAQEQPIYQEAPFSRPTSDLIEDLESPYHFQPAPELEEVDLIQEFDFQMSNWLDQEPTLADLLREEKFSQDMWRRRRSTAVGLPSTYQPDASTMRTNAIGSGWRLKPAARNADEAVARPAAAYQRRDSRTSENQHNNRPSFSRKRSSMTSSSTSTSSSNPQSPDEAKLQRRDSIFKRWSIGARSPTDEEMLEFALSSMNQRVPEIKRRKTMEEYEIQDQLAEDTKEDEDMLFS